MVLKIYPEVDLTKADRWDF